jgi:uncharacterized membrane protein
LGNGVRVKFGHPVFVLLNIGELQRRKCRLKELLSASARAQADAGRKRREAMSNLVVFGFDGIHTADEVLNKLRAMQQEYLIDLEDSCVVERDASGKVAIKQAVNLTSLGAKSGGASGALWGTLVGLLFLNPLAGMAIGALTGAGAGAIAGSLADYGISDDFVRKLGETIPPASSALFILFKQITEDKVMREIEPFKPRVLKTSLPDEAEHKLRTELAQAA